MYHPDVLYRHGLQRQHELHREAAAQRAVYAARGSLRSAFARALSALALRLEPELRSEPQQALRG